MVFSQNQWVVWYFDLKEEGMPASFRWWIIGIVVVNFVISYTVEKWVIWKLSIWWRRKEGQGREVGGEKEIEMIKYKK